MRIGIVNNNKNNLYSSKQQLMFQGVRPERATDVILNSTRVLNSKTPDVNKLKLALRKTIKALKLNTDKNTDFILNFSNQKGSLTRKLKSNDIEKQKETIDKIFDLKSTVENKRMYINDVDKYIWNTVVPLIQNSKNAELADYILAKVPNNIEKLSASACQERVDFIAALGNKSHIEELKRYAGEQVGISSYVKQVAPSYVKTVGETAEKAIESLSITLNA